MQLVHLVIGVVGEGNGIFVNLSCNGLFTQSVVLLVVVQFVVKPPPSISPLHLSSKSIRVLANGLWYDLSLDSTVLGAHVSNDVLTTFDWVLHETGSSPLWINVLGSRPLDNEIRILFCAYGMLPLTIPHEWESLETLSKVAPGQLTVVDFGVDSSLEQSRVQRLDILVEDGWIIERTLHGV